MKGINGLMDALLSPSARMYRKDSNSEADGISFGQFMQKWKGDRVNSTGKKNTIGKEEQQLLEKSLEHLLNFKLELGNARKKTALTMDEMKKLLQRMGQDTGFLNSLTPELKSVLQKLLQMLKEGKEIKLDTKGLDELTRIWNRELEKKREKMMAEVDELLAAIQERLALAGITVKAQVVEKNGEKTIQVTFYKAANPDGFAQTMANLRTNDENGAAVLAKALISRLASFLGGADGTEKAELNRQTFELREDLRKYLKKESQPVGWRKEEIMHKAQLGNLQELLEEADPAETAKMEQLLSTSAVENLLKEEAAEIVTHLQVMPDADEVLVMKEVQENDTFANLLTGLETNSRDLRNLLENIVREEQPQPFVKTEELFQQMVEKFRLDIKQGVSQMEIRLHPAELGNMYLKLTVEKGLVTAQFLAESVRVKELIEQNIAQLRDTFAKDGITWDKITVDVSQDNLRENPFAYQGQRDMKDQRNSNGKRQNFADSMAEELELAESELAERVPMKDPSRLVDYRA